MLSDEDELRLTGRLAALEVRFSLMGVFSAGAARRRNDAALVFFVVAWRPLTPHDTNQSQSATGWRLRVVTVDGLSRRGGREEARAALSLPAYASALPSFDRRTVVLQADPSAPSLLSVPYAGDDALKALGRPFFSELESRFGNQFYARDNGSPKALRDAVASLELCLARDPPCRVVPGLPDEQLAACVTFAICGGLIAGSASKIKGGNGPAQWVALFGPLWFSLVASFGVGPVVSRLAAGEREGPLAMVLGAFFAAALLPWAPEALGTRRPPPSAGE